MADSNPHILSDDVKQCLHCGVTFRREPCGDKWYFRRKRRFCSFSCAGSSSTKHRPLAERLFEKTEKRGDNECWPWIGLRTTAGYGAFSFHNKSMYAHRASYEVHNGPIPDGMVVCHRCDNPRCVNPNHLFIGSQTDNLHDMIRKGRAKLRPQIGTDHGCAKLTEDDVLAIRADCTRSGRAIAKAFSISQTQVSDIKTRKAWRHI